MSFDVARTPAEAKLNRALRKLLQDEPFFAAVSRQITKVESEFLPTMGVAVDEKYCTLTMYYNPEFTLSLSDEVCYNVLLHEMYHVTLGHVTSRRRSIDKADYKKWNFATDLAINSIICSGNKGSGAINPSVLTEGACIPTVNVFKNMPAHKSSEWYFVEISKQQEKYKDSGEGSDHSGWGTQSEVCDKIVDIANAKLREVMRRASEDCNRSDKWGSIPANMKEEIKKFIAGPPIDWRAIMKFFVQKSVKSGKRNTIKRLNRRYPYMYPGIKAEHSAHLAVFVDQSGSVSDDLLGLLAGQLDTLSDICSFTVINFDFTVDESSRFEWRKGQHFDSIKRTRCGGTNFDAPTNWVNENAGFDALLIVTDMEADKPGFCKIQRAWLTYEGYHKCFETEELVIEVPKVELEEEGKKKAA